MVTTIQQNVQRSQPCANGMFAQPSLSSSYSSLSDSLPCQPILIATRVLLVACAQLLLIQSEPGWASRRPPESLPRNDWPFDRRC